MTESQRILTRMLVSTINARELEANRVSRLLHDEVGQVLSAVGLQLDVLRLDFQKAVPDLGERTKEIQEMLDQAVRQVRALSYDLNPAVVERAGLQFAMDRLVGRFRTDFPGSLRFLYDSSVRVPLEVGNAWYKIAEMALENSLKHSKATQIEVFVRPAPKAITLEIRDNGIGFSVDKAKLEAAGLGLLLMEHYAAQASVDIVMKSSPGKGTTVRSSYRRPAEEPAAGKGKVAK